MIKYLYTDGPNSKSILVTGEFTRTVASTSPRFEAVKEYLENTPQDELDEAHLMRLLDAGTLALTGLTRLSERITFNGSQILFDGDVLASSITSHIVRMVRNGDDSYQAFVRFLENLWTNPSVNSRDQLFDWLQDRHFTITEDGRFLAYKGVRREGNYSIHPGKATVNGEEITGPIPNPIGAIVEMPRSTVDDRSHEACSTGLHAGTATYARNYGERLLLVAINPRDVVSVPSDSEFQKLRTCRYEVLEEADGQLEDTTYVGSRRYDPVAEDFDDLEEEATLCLECGDETDGDEYCDEECEARANGEFEDDDYWSEEEDAQDEQETTEEDEPVSESRDCPECGDDLPEGEEGPCEDCQEYGVSGVIIPDTTGPGSLFINWFRKSK
jgi:hypothetical protein